jgi:ribonuclease E
LPPALPPPREEPVKPAAVSLWHKIFGSPAEQTSKLSDMPSAAGEVDEVRGVPAESDDISISDTPRSLSGADVFSEEYVVESARSEAQLLEPSESEERTRGRPRRRRRGGRGRGRRSGEQRRTATSDAMPRDSLESGDDFDDLGVSDPDDDLTVQELAGDGELTAEDAEPLADDDAAENGRSKAAQRTIPSWEEAIGFIVDTNMQTRSQRRPPSRSTSRGRSRSRRKD